MADASAAAEGEGGGLSDGQVDESEVDLEREMTEHAPVHRPGPAPRACTTRTTRRPS